MDQMLTFCGGIVVGMCLGAASVLFWIGRIQPQCCLCHRRGWFTEMDNSPNGFLKYHTSCPKRIAHYR